MKVLLINPPETVEKNSLTVLGLPLGILSIAAVLEKAGKEARIFDAITYTDGLAITNLQNRKIRIGASWERIEKEIAESKPDVLGISNHFSSQIDNALKVAEIAKKVDRNIITAIGGPHASSMPQDFLKEKNIDFVVMGEGENAFLELVNRLESNKGADGISNLAFRKNGKDIINPVKAVENLDEIPLPAYHMINMENYFRISRELGRVTIGTGHDRKISMITSRGCPYNCIFCSIHCHMGRKWRAHSSQYVIRHIKYLIDNFRVNHISFEDDNLVLDTKRFEEILDGIVKNGMKITWDTPNGIRADRVDFGLLKRMKNAGCSSIKIGVESGDQQVLDRIVGKNLRLERVIEVADACRKIGMPAAGFFIIGYPGEKKINIRHTLEFAYMLKKKYYMDSVITIAMPLIGTKMYEISKEKNYLVKGNNPSEFGGKNSFVIETGDFNLDYLKSERNKFYRRVMLLQILQVLSMPSLFWRYANLLKNPKSIMNIIRYLTKND